MITPAPFITKRQMAMHMVAAKKTPHGTFAIFQIDHRALERNKYAPWGRGELGGRSVK